MVGRRTNLEINWGFFGLFIFRGSHTHAHTPVWLFEGF